MKRFASLLIVTTLLTMPALAGPAEEVRDAETAFAKAFADRDKARFSAFILDEATFLSRKTMTGKAAVMERWSTYLATPKATFSWAPERVAVNAAGTIGESTGPVFDAAGHQIGNFVSVWVKQADGAWKVLFDGPGGAPACLPENAPALVEGDIVTPDGAKLHYRKIGEGGQTLIVPLSSLYDAFRQLADVATIISYDPRRLTNEQDVQDLETIRAHFKVEKFIPIGSSSLGLMVAMYAAEHPEHVTRLIQLGPAPRKSEDLARITMPVLTIHGTKDPNAPYSSGREWAKLLPDARLVTLEGAAHAVWLDDPATVFGSIRAFIRGDWPLRAEKIAATVP